MTAPNFIDCSHFQSDAPKHPINWAKVRAAGIIKCYLKATESINFHDPAFPRDWPGAKAAGIARGAYLFFRGDKGGAAQAHYFSDYVGIDRGELPPAVDVEAVATGVSRATYTQRLLDCLEVVEMLFGRRPVIYTSAGKWSELTTNPGWVSSYSLWLAAPDTAVPPLPVGAVTWYLHQWSWVGQVDGIDGDVDLDRENVITPPDPTLPIDHAAAIRAHAVAIQGLAV